MIDSKYELRDIQSFYKGKKVFVTGHTGFKGTWLTTVLLRAGAVVTGYSLEPPTEPSLFRMAGLDDPFAEGDSDQEFFSGFTHIIGDVRDREKLTSSIIKAEPDVVFHLAAQPIVRESYKDPVGTYETNVMGTVNLLEAVRIYSESFDKDGSTDKSKRISVLNITTDKVYKNNEWCWGYREDEPLDGYDPYSNSKSCSELVTHSYKRAFFDVAEFDTIGEGLGVEEKADGAMGQDGQNPAKVGSDNPVSRVFGRSVEPVVRVSTARAGNVIGGGDFASDRIIPDCVRAIADARKHNHGEGEIIIRNKASIRPYQHVLDPIFAYLMIAAGQYENASFAGYYNVGPDESSCITTGELVKIFSGCWNQSRNTDFVSYALPELRVVERIEHDTPHESRFLKLDTSKLKDVFGWRPVWDIEKALRKTADFMRVMMVSRDEGAIRDEMVREIEEFVGDGIG